MVMSPRKFVKPRGLLISIFLFSILLSYNNCARVEKNSLNNYVEVRLAQDGIQEVDLKENETRIRFKVVKLDDKVYSLSKFSIYPFSHKHEQIIITQGKKGLKISLDNRNKDRTGTHLFRTEKNNNLVKIGLR